MVIKTEFSLLTIAVSHVFFKIRTSQHQIFKSYYEFFQHCVTKPSGLNEKMTTSIKVQMMMIRVCRIQVAGGQGAVPGFLEWALELNFTCLLVLHNKGSMGQFYLGHSIVIISCAGQWSLYNNSQDK